MTAQPNNRFVFLCRGRGVRCKWKPDFASFLYKDKWWLVTHTFYFMLCKSSLFSAVISFVYKDGGSIKACQLFSVWKIFEKEFFYSLSTLN